MGSADGKTDACHSRVIWPYQRALLQGRNCRLRLLHLTLHSDSRTCLWTGAEALDKGLCLVKIVSVKSSRHINGGNRPSPLIQFP